MGDTAILRQHPDLIDMTKFAQLLEMDDDDRQFEFSSSVCIDWMEQSKAVYSQLDEAMSVNKGAKFDKLFSHARFLEGSAKSVGAIKVTGISEVLKRLGKRQDATKADMQDDNRVLQEANVVLIEAKVAPDQTAAIFRRFYTLGDNKEE
ncbi:uncharacterized protein FTOL_07335 [Fusarium torulosum]|uniref:Uncharacterized protein n=1 Tax=Fusarium torulosum TaxID=33205 RepID=A0AAE8MAN4_9HYPO|nr:uncharacterized protein FTOL_07335 [Fusarium torulosum]